MALVDAVGKVCEDCAGTGGVLDDGSMTGASGAPIACPSCTGFWDRAVYGEDDRPLLPVGTGVRRVDTPWSYE